MFKMKFYPSSSSFTWLDPEVKVEIILTDDPPRLLLSALKDKNKNQKIFDISEISKRLTNDELIKLIGSGANCKIKETIDNQIVQLKDEVKEISQCMKGTEVIKSVNNYQIYWWVQLKQNLNQILQANEFIV